MKHVIRLVIALAVAICFCTSQKVEAGKINKQLVIVIDPGHGGTESGAKVTYDGTLIEEKDLNLTIAKALKKELKTYEGVKVYMTRTADENVSLEERVRYAEKKNADVILSIHNNAKGSAMETDTGATVIVSRGTYRKELAKTSAGAANYVLKELKKLGMKNNGLLKREYPSKYYYPNKTIVDYYSIIRNSVNAGIPAMIIEHGFMDNASDYEKVLSSTAKLKELGKADATGIARYFGLKKSDGSKSYKAKGVKTKYLSAHWLAKGDKKYYVYDNGKYAKGWTKIGKKWYKFSKTGVFIRKK